jgi:uncharacterized RDD family membrane protein YckC
MNNEQMIQNPAGFWVRLAALLIDGLIMGIPLSIAGIMFSKNLGVNISTSILSILYSLVLPVVWNGQTIGKRILGIRIKKLSGEKVGFGTMLMRNFVAGLIYSITLGIAFIASILMVAFRKDKRSVHDMVAGTYVG